MLGKQKCKILKDIRRRIADENDIPYITRECSFQGECSGTCPRCESELRWLEQQLALRTSMKKRVTVAALCAGMTLAAVGCTPAPGTGTPPDSDTTIEDLSGEVPPCENTDYSTETVEQSTQPGSEDSTGSEGNTGISPGSGEKPVDIEVETTGEVPYEEYENQ